MTLPATALEPDQPVVKPAPLHLGYIDGLRGLAALYVMFVHLKLIAFWDSRHASVPIDILTDWITFGHFAVDLFIVISGFCLMLPVVKADGVLRGGPRNFYERRIRRIVPPYYAALALSILLGVTILSHKTGTLWDYALPVTKKGILLHVFLLQNFGNAMEINTVFWSIAVESQIYIFFPFLVGAYARKDIIKLITTIVVISCAASVALQHTKLSGITCQYFGLFAMGNLAALVALSKNPRWLIYQKVNWHVVTITLFLFLVALCSLPGHTWERLPTGCVDVVVGAWAAALLLTCARFSHSPPIRILSWKPVTFVGAFSYSLYLMHMPLLQLVWQYAIQPLRLSDTFAFLVLSTVGAVVVILLTYIFHLAFERPFMNKPQRRAALPSTDAPVVANR